ncbi:MAG: STAS domain-containing protein [Gemmatimonadota bacterium]|nr:STAS domain-containing protein [Gemmatimonadota bacterium]
MSELKLEDQEFLCVFSKHMGTNECKEIESDFEAGLAGKPFTIIFDLKEVEYISSTFLRFCIRAAKSVEQGKFSVINVKPDIKKIFKMAGVDSILNIS